jgi:hypothetical protein
VGRSKIRPVCDRGVKLVLHSFTRETDGTVADGAFPEAGLIFDINGALYGTTSTGGSSKNVTFDLMDPGLSGLAFCLFRCDPEGGMKPLTIVVSFDVGEQVTEHGCRGSPRQKSRPRSSTKRGPFLRASLRTKWKRMQRFCQVTRECPVKFPRREGHLFLPVEDGPARVGRSTLRAPRLRAQAQQRERSKPEIAAGRTERAS